MPDSFFLDGKGPSEEPELPMVTLARVPYVTQNEHGCYPAGTKCSAQRGEPPDFNIILEFEDGSTVELPEWYHLDGYERPGASIVAVEDRRCMAYLTYQAEKRWPDRYNRPKVI